ncbi:MAG: (2Fe-2S)-binding protein [Dermatophilaceae bacterium]
MAHLSYSGHTRPVTSDGSDAMIVCHCRVVNDAAITNAIEGGAATLGQVCRTTGAGVDCGTCVFSVKRLLCEHDESPRPALPEVTHAAS